MSRKPPRQKKPREKMPREKIPREKKSANSQAILTHASRAGVGLAITGGAVAAIVLLGSVAMPTIEIPPAAATVDTSTDTTRTLACAGSALDLGGDPSRPLLGIPTGVTELTEQDATNTGLETSTFVRESDIQAMSSFGEAQQGTQSTQAGSGVLLTMDGSQSFTQALSESEMVDAATLSGFMATQCIEASNESWIVGGTTTLGSVTLLSLTNPGDVAATVFVNVYDEQGLVESLQTAGVVIAPKSQRTVSINGAAPERSSLAVHVLSRGAKVVATMQESLVEGLKPAGIDTIQGLSRPSTSLVIPGISSPKVEGAAVSDVHETGSGLSIRVLAPGDQGGVVTVTGVSDEGKRVKLVTEYVQPGRLTEFALEALTEEFTTVVVDAEVEVVASIAALSLGTEGEDIAWFTAATAIDREIPFAVPAGPGAHLGLFNPGDAAVSVELVLADGDSPEENLRLTVEAGASLYVPIAAASGFQLLPGGPVFAAITFTGDGMISSFPIVPPQASADTVQVYTR